MRNGRSIGVEHDLRGFQGGGCCGHGNFSGGVGLDDGEAFAGMGVTRGGLEGIVIGAIGVFSRGDVAGEETVKVIASAAEGTPIAFSSVMSCADEGDAVPIGSELWLVGGEENLCWLAGGVEFVFGDDFSVVGGDGLQSAGGKLDGPFSWRLVGGVGL